MNVLITGAGGFMGAYLTQLAVNAGHTVLGIDTQEPDAGAFAGKFERADVRDIANLRNYYCVSAGTDISPGCTKLSNGFDDSAVRYDANQRWRNDQHF